MFFLGWRNIYAHRNIKQKNNKPTICLVYSVMLMFLRRWKVIAILYVCRSQTFYTFLYIFVSFQLVCLIILSDILKNTFQFSRHLVSLIKKVNHALPHRLLVVSLRYKYKRCLKKTVFKCMPIRFSLWLCFNPLDQCFDQTSI